MPSDSATTQILFLYGVPDDSSVHIVIRERKRELVVMGSSNLFLELESHLNAREILLVGTADEDPVQLGPRPALIFNQISDADTHKITLNRVTSIAASTGVRTLNHPNLIRRTTRDLISQMLSGQPGLIVPKTIRCSLAAPSELVERAEESGLSFPLLVRNVGSHGGENMVRVSSVDDLDPLNALALDGREFYVTEFVDFRSEDGLYRKCRLAFVDGNVFLLHWSTHEGWNVHTRMARDYVEARGGDLEKEEENLTERFYDGWSDELSPAFNAIQEAVQLEFFGVDAFITSDDRVGIFEVNANMNMMPPRRANRIRTPFRQAQRDRLRNALLSMFSSRLVNQ